MKRSFSCVSPLPPLPAPPPPPPAPPSPSSPPSSRYTPKPLINFPVYFLSIIMNGGEKKTMYTYRMIFLNVLRILSQAIYVIFLFFFLSKLLRLRNYSLAKKIIFFTIFEVRYFFNFKTFFFFSKAHPSLRVTSVLSLEECYGVC